MKKILVFLVCLSLLICVLTGISHAWQGRMGGMDDPYGLLQDESDFLIHPVKIVTGEGVKFYSHYRFAYTGVADWKVKRSFFTPAGVLTQMYLYDFAGDEYKHEALLGSSFPLGQGRLGVFFTYDGMRGAYEGDFEILTPSNMNVELENDLDAFAVRLIYGLPLDNLSLGGEIQLAYRQEESLSMFNNFGGGVVFLNFWGAFQDIFIPPYESSYVEALLKGSFGGAFGPVETVFTLRGGLILGGGGNTWEEYQRYGGGSQGGVDMDGNVEGWRIGSDFWMRYPISNNLTLPFLVRIDYLDRTRDGDDEGFAGSAGDLFDYEHIEQRLAIVVGGGLDREFGPGIRSAGGIYYHYLQGNNELTWNLFDATGWLANETFMIPDGEEHRVVVRLAGERELSPVVILRGGLDLFYGWVNQEQGRTSSGSSYLRDTTTPIDGYHWGIGASLGGTVRFKHLTLEPFVNAGYQVLDITGDGTMFSRGALSYLTDYDENRQEWLVNTGVSITLGSQDQRVEQASTDIAEPSTGEPSVTAHKCPKCGRTFPTEYVYCPFDKTELKTVQVKK